LVDLSAAQSATKGSIVEGTNAKQLHAWSRFQRYLNLGVVSAFVFGIAKFLLKVGALSEALAQGLIICGCLALTVNMVFILTAKAGGDEALGIFHAAFVSCALSSVVEHVS
jgi:predicted Na+-dependent transporter